MKIVLKGFFAIFALLGASLVGLYLYASSESVQRGYLESVLKENFAGEASFKSVKADFSSIYLSELSLENEDFSFSAEEVLLSYDNPISLIFSELNVKDFQLKNSSLEIFKKEDASKKDTLLKDALCAEKTNQSGNTVKTSVPVNADSAGQDIQVHFAEDENPSDFILNIEKINADILLKNLNGTKAILNAQSLSLKGFKDLKNLSLDAKFSGGVLEDDLTLTLQVREDSISRNLQALLIDRDEELLKLKADYRYDFENVQVLSSGRISEDTLALKSIKNSGFKLDFYASLNAENFFESMEGTLNLDGESKYLKFDSKELNLLSNSKLKLNTHFKANSGLLKVESFDGELIHEDESLAILKLSKTLDLDINNLSVDRNLSNFATLYVDRIPYSILSAYMPEYELSDNKIKAHLNLSFDNEEKALVVDTKEKVYFNAIEIIKNEAILISDVFLATEFSAKMDLKKNLSASIKLLFVESAKKEVNAEILVEKSPEKLDANISLKGDALVFLNYAQAHVDNVDRIRNSKLEINTHLISEGEKMEIDNLKIKVFDGDFKLFDIVLSDKLFFENFELQNEIFSAKILAQSLPFTPFKSFIKDVDATSISCDIDIEKAGESIKAKGFLSLENMSYYKDSEKIFAEIYPKIDFDLKAVGDDISAKIDRLSFAYNGTEFARASGDIEANLKLENYITKLDSNISLYLPSLMQVPDFKEYNNIQSGYAEILLTYDKDSIEAKTKLSNLKLRSENGYIASVDLDAKSNLKSPEKNLDLELSIASSRGNSYLGLKNTLNGSRINSKLDSTRIIFEDLEFLSKLASKLDGKYTPPPPRSSVSSNVKKPTKAKETLSFAERKERAMKAAQASTGVRDVSAPMVKNTTLPSLPKKDVVIENTNPSEKAFWDFGYSLNLDAKFDSISYDNETRISDLNAKIILDDKSFSSKNIKFDLANSNESKASFVLDFDKNKRDSYELKEFNLFVDDVDMAKLTWNTQTASSRMAGILSFDLDLYASEPTPELLLQNLKGTANINSKGNGMIKFVDSDSYAGSGAEIASSLIGIAGNFLGNKAKEVQAVNVLIKLFKEFYYTKLLVNISRGESLDINIDKLGIESSDILIEGKGKIEYSDYFPIQEQSLNINLYTYIIDSNVADLFSKLNLIKAQSNKQNLSQGPTFLIYGTLNNIESNVSDIFMNSAKDTVKGASSNILNKFF